MSSLTSCLVVHNKDEVLILPTPILLTFKQINFSLHISATG